MQGQVIINSTHSETGVALLYDMIIYVQGSSETSTWGRRHNTVCEGLCPDAAVALDSVVCVGLQKYMLSLPCKSNSVQYCFL